MSLTEIDILCLAGEEARLDEALSLLHKDHGIRGFYHESTRIPLSIETLFDHLREHTYHLILLEDRAFEGSLNEKRLLNLIGDLSDRYPMTPILRVSDKQQPEVIVNTIRAGAINHATPLNQPRLADAIAEVVKTSSIASKVSPMNMDVPGFVYQLVMDSSGEFSMPFTPPFLKSLTNLSNEQLAENASSIFDGVHRDDRPGLLASIAESADKMSPWQKDFRVLTPDRRLVWIRGMSKPSQQPDGSVIWNGLMMDVTDEKLASAAASTREKSILDTVIDGIITIDERGIIESVNKAAEYYFEYSENELLGKNISMLMPVEYAHLHDNYLTKYRETGETKIIGVGRIVEGLKKNGGLFPIDLAVSEMWINGQRKFTGVVRDISQRLETEANLRHSEERLRLSHQFAGMITWEWDLLTDDLYWSNRFGEEAPTPLKVRFEQFMDGIHRDDRDAVMSAIDKCIKEGIDYKIEHRAFGKGGELRWVLEQGNVVRDPDGRAIRMIGVAQDITSRKTAEKQQQESELRLKEAQRLAQLGHWDYDFRTNSLSWSDNIYTIFGLDRNAIQPTTEGFFDSIFKSDSKAVDTLRDRDLLSRFPEQNIDYRMVMPGGDVRWVHMESTTQFDENKEIIGLNGIIQDITERKLAELELINAKEEAEKARREADQANLAKSRFLSHMSHELRTPMNAILGFTQLLELEKDLSESQMEAVSEIHHASDHLLDLINDVLDLSRIEAGKIILSIKPLRIDSVIKDCLGLVTSMAEQKGVNVSWDQDESTDYFVYVDETRIKEVILNLLSNAIKYNNPGGRVHVKTQLRPRKKMRLLVEDTGTGIPDIEQGNLFKSFNRLGAENSDVEGTGIGLVICKRLVEMMGGQIGFSSKEEEGSCFWVDVPLTRNFTETNQPNPSGGNEPASFEVLYVEDNSTNLRLVQQIMGRRPFVNLTSTPDGNHALDLVSRLSPNLILLDINLPDMSGLDLVEKMREVVSREDIPIVALSSIDLPQNTEVTIGQKFDEYMTKPINVRRLLNLIDELSGNKTSQRLDNSQT